MKVWVRNYDAEKETQSSYFFCLEEFDEDIFDFISILSYSVIFPAVSPKYGIYCGNNEHADYADTFHDAVCIIHGRYGMSERFSWVWGNDRLYLCPIGDLDISNPYGNITLSNDDQDSIIFTVVVGGEKYHFSDFLEAKTRLVNRALDILNDDTMSTPENKFALAFIPERGATLAFLSDRFGLVHLTDAILFTSEEKAKLYKDYHAEFNEGNKAWLCSKCFVVDIRAIT